MPIVLTTLKSLSDSCDRSICLPPVRSLVVCETGVNIVGGSRVTKSNRPGWHLVPFFLALTAAFLILARWSSGEGPPRFVLIGSSNATGLSADGKSVTGVYSTPYLWRESSGLRSIPLPAGYEMFSVNDISGDGTTIVGGVALGT